MDFETEYQLKMFREIQNQYFDEEGNLWGGLQTCNMTNIMGTMFRLINQMEVELIKNDLSDDDKSLDQVFADMDKAKDDLFESIGIICKDYNDKHLKNK